MSNGTGGTGDRRRAAAGPAAALVALVGLVGLNGCTATGNQAAPSSTTSTVTAGTLTSVVATTVTSTLAGAVVTAAPPAATAEPAPVAGPCPYLTDDDVAQINGQHTGTTTVIDVAPYPICVFTRSDGGPLATVRIVQADTPEAAQAAVNDHVPIEKSNPAGQPAGWAGGSMVTDAGSVYAVAKGTVAVVAESNQQQSIKGRQLAMKTITALGL